MTKTRDSKRKQYYMAENRVFRPGGTLSQLEDLTPAAKAFVRFDTERLLTKEIHKMYRAHLKRPISPHATKYGNPTWEAAMPTVVKRRGAGAWANGHELSFGSRACVRWLLCHELAHTLTNRTVTMTGEFVGDEPWHNWRWAHVYLRLVKRHCGLVAYRHLLQSFKDAKLKYNPPRAKKVREPDHIPSARFPVFQFLTTL